MANSRQIFSQTQLETGDATSDKLYLSGSKSYAVENYSNYGIDILDPLQSNSVIKHVLPWTAQYMQLDASQAVILLSENEAYDSSEQLSLLAGGEVVNLVLFNAPIDRPFTEQLSTGVANQIVVQSGTFNLSGTPTFKIASGQSVDTTGSTVNIQLPSGITSLPVAFPAAQQVNVEDNVNSNVLNEVIGVNPLAGNGAPSGTTNVTITDLASGAIIALVQVDIPLGEYDQLSLAVSSSSSLITSYEFTPQRLYYKEMGLDTSDISNIGSWSYAINNSQIAFTNLLSIPEGIADGIILAIKNTSATNITSDTLTINVFAKYASTTVNNTESNPATTQGATLSQSGFDASVSVPTGSSTTTVTLVASGGYISQLTFTPLVTYSAGDIVNAVLYNGTEPIGTYMMGKFVQTASTTFIAFPEDYTWTPKERVVNNGITAVFAQNSSNTQSGTITGNAITS